VSLTTAAGAATVICLPLHGRRDVFAVVHAVVVPLADERRFSASANGFGGLLVDLVFAQLRGFASVD